MGYGEGFAETGYCCQKLQKLVGGTRSKTYSRVSNLKWKLFGNNGKVRGELRGVRREIAEISARWRGISGEKAGGGYERAGREIEW